MATEQVNKDSKGNKVYLFKEEKQQNNFMENLNMLRKDRQFCDVILQVGANQDIHEVYAHKVVLSSSSPYLLEMFSSDLSSNRNVNGNSPQQYRLVSNTTGNGNSGVTGSGKHAPNIEFDPEAFEYIIEYAYTGTLKIPENKVREIYAIASRLRMSYIAYKCAQVLVATLSSENCLEIRNMKSVLKDQYLLQSVDSYIRQNFGLIVQSSNSNTQLSQIKIEFLLNSAQEENSINDKHLFNEILDWLRQSLLRINIDLDTLKENSLMLYYNKDLNEIQDCTQMESDFSEESEMIENYKKLNKKLSFVKSLSNDNITCGVSNKNGYQNKSTVPSKPRQFMFTRSDSDNSLSSITDDDGKEWKLLANCRIGKHTLVGLVSILGELYFLSLTLRIKGNGSKSIDETENDEYCIIPPMSSPRCSVGTAEFQGKLLVCGGYDRGECLKTVEIYDTVKNKWILGKPMQISRGRFDIAVVNGNVYAIGGCDGQRELNSAELYDPMKFEWRSIQSAPVARSNAGICSMGTKIYMIGGWNGTRGMTRCDVYDAITQIWAQIGSLNTGRYQMGACVLDDIIYAVGGCDSWSCLNSVEAFIDDNWQLITPLQTARRGCGVTSYKGKLYAVGGHDGIHALCSVEIYDPVKKTWTFGKPMTTARANVGVAIVNNRLYAVGGFNGKTFLNTIEYFDFESNQWTTSIPIMSKNTCLTNANESNSKMTVNKESGVDILNDTNNNNQKATNGNIEFIENMELFRS